MFYLVSLIWNNHLHTKDEPIGFYGHIVNLGVYLAWKQHN